MNERQTIDRGWYYVIEPEDGRWAPPDALMRASDGTCLTRRLHGHPSRIEVVDDMGEGTTVATLLRASGAVGRALEQRGLAQSELKVILGSAGTVPRVEQAEDGRTTVILDGHWVAASPSHHPVEASVAELLEGVKPEPRLVAPDPSGLPERAVPRAMFFESLMNTDMPHNDKEISQGVLHLVSPLAELKTEVVMVNAKMSITGTERGVQGLENLHAALAGGTVHLVGITVLEGYWEGVVHLIRTIRDLGCRAHIAVGGVMPSLAPEHVAAHLDEVTFVCRGAGEYFMPKLAKLVGPNDVDTPLTPAQRHAALQMDGMIVIDRAGKRLLSCRSDRTITVEDLDRVGLDLQFLHPRHIEGGIEISTSRGCIHKCSFCSILGREAYQARSAGSVFDVLDCYQARFEELFGDRIPENSYRVHFSDDDFACDKQRAAEVFRRILDTPFRLSSVQVAIGDLCKRVDGKLLAEPDLEIMDAIRPECFADHGRPIPKIDFYEDHRSRNWSSFLQIGVETYSDREIARLGKGYKRVHVRTIVAELARRGIHMDGYFILSNVDTEAEDLVEVFTEVARLKLRFPEHFHMRFPVVQHLVSYFTSASHRRHVRRGRRDAMVLRGHAQVPGHGELDYPFVDHDEPRDPWTQATVAHTFVTDSGLYTENLAVLSAMWKPRYKQLASDDPDRARIGALLRTLDDRPRRVVFEMLRQAWLGDDTGWPEARLDKTMCLETAERVLGPQETWMHLLRHVVRADPERRLVWSSALPAERWPEAMALVLATDQPTCSVQLVRTDDHDGAIGDWLACVSDLPPKQRKRLRVLVDASCLPSDLGQLSAVGAEVQWVWSAGHDGPLERLSDVMGAGLVGRAIIRVSPANLEGLSATLHHVLDAGVTSLVVEPTDRWEPADAQRLGGALFAVGARLKALDVTEIVPGAERSGWDTDVAVDGRGHITRSDLVLGGQDTARGRRLGRLEDLTNIDRHHLELAEPDRLRRVATLEQLARRVGPAMKVLRSFQTWLQAERTPVGDVRRGAGADARS